MKKIFWTCVGWLTIPGFMHLMHDHELNNQISSITRQSMWTTTGLSVIAMLVYGSIALYFGDPSFRNTGKEILSPLFALVWLPNLVVAIMGTLALLTTKGVSKT